MEHKSIREIARIELKLISGGFARSDMEHTDHYPLILIVGKDYSR